MRIALFGAAGMLGKEILDLCPVEHEIVPIYRSSYDMNSPISINKVLDRLEIDAAINCSAVLPVTGSTPIDMVRVNALFPHLLVQAAASRRVILVSTDRVFSGTAGVRYEIGFRPDATDYYGKTRAAGECVGQNTCIVRASYIGKEHGFLKWLLGAEGEVEGWKNSLWAGSTVDQVAQAILNLVDSSVGGLQHLATRHTISKLEVAEIAQQVYQLPITIRPSLSPVINYSLMPTIELPPIDEAIRNYAKRDDGNSSDCSTHLQSTTVRAENHTEYPKELAGT